MQRPGLRLLDIRTSDNISCRNTLLSRSGRWRRAVRSLRKTGRNNPSRTRRVAVQTKAFLGQTDALINKDTFPEPLEYAALLGLQGKEGSLQDTHIISAYEELASAPLESGYTRKVEEGRLVLLHAAVDGMRKLRSMIQRSNRQNLAMQEARQAWVQWWLFPSALSLLQETGQSEVVLELGRAALSKRESGPFRRDILLTMALAHCSLSSEAFAGRDQVGVGCAHLEEALGLLESAGFVPGMSKLASEIQEGLRELKPHCVIEHLRWPVNGEAKPTRRQAIGVLKTLLANPELAVKSDGSSGVDKKFVRDSLIQLSSSETVSLLDWEDIANNGSTIPWYFDGLLERGGVAHIVAGFQQKRPALIEQGAALLRNQRKADLLLERVATCVLLADTPTASHLLLEAESRGYFKRESKLADALRESHTSSPGIVSDAMSHELPSRGDTLDFIRAHSPDGDEDLVPGLCLFTERWLAKVAFSRFKDSQDGQIEPSLTNYFESERVTSYISVKNRDTDGFRAGLLVLSDRLSHSLQRLRDSPLSTKNARSHKKTALPKLKLLDRHAAAPKTALPLVWFRKWQNSRFSPKTIATAVVFAIAAWMAMSWLRKSKDTYLLAQPQSTMVEEAPTEAIQEPAPSRIWQWRAPWQKDDSAPRLRARVADSCIRKWQVAKGLAMGPRHDESLLSESVAEPYLSTVKKDAASARKAGWFWSYKLSDLYIENVDNSNLKEDGSGSALVTAKLRERGELFAVSGKRADQHCYDNAYRAEYTLVQLPDHSWRISNVLVLGEE